MLTHTEIPKNSHKLYINQFLHPFINLIFHSFLIRFFNRFGVYELKNMRKKEMYNKYLNHYSKIIADNYKLRK